MKNDEKKKNSNEITMITKKLTPTNSKQTQSITTSRLNPDLVTKKNIENPNVLSSKQSKLERKRYFFSSLLAGIGSGAISSVVCAPLDLIRTRMQVIGSLSKAEAAETSSRTHIIQALKEIVAVDGVKGCFRGLGATLATVPAFWGLYFPLYDHLKGTLTHYVQEDSSSNEGQTHPFVHMTSAILAGSVADFVCNPMFVVRTRMQTEFLHSPTTHLTIRDTIGSLYSEGGILIFWRGLTASLMGLSHVAIQFPV